MNPDGGGVVCYGTQNADADGPATVWVGVSADADEDNLFFFIVRPFTPRGDEAVSAAATTVPAGTATTFGDGRFEVGTEIQPGLYQTVVTAEDPLCLVSVWVTPTEEDIMQGMSVSTKGTHYFEVSADVHSVEFESIDDACAWIPST